MVLIPWISVIIGIMIIIIPFMILYILVKKYLKKEQENKNLELRIEVLENEIRQIKEHINYIDELWWA